jgi:hypothetical protein
MRSDLTSLDDDQVSALLSDLADGTAEIEPDLRVRLEQDLRFQAELVQYRKLLRAMASLRSEQFEPDDTLVAEVLASLDDADRAGLLSVITGRRAAYLGGIAAATAAGVGTALVLVRRRAA